MGSPDRSPRGDDGIRQEAGAYDSAIINQAGRDQHLHFGAGSRRVVPALGSLDAACPYPGLAAFATEQAEWFFGRDQLASDLLTRLSMCLTEGGPLMVVAASGAGKSSLLRAGLLHEIAEGRLTSAGSRHWPQIVLTPAAFPMREAASALVAAVPGVQNDAGAPASPDADELDGLLRRAVESAVARSGSAGPAVIIVDQLEELFTLCSSESDRAAFISWLWRAARRDGSDGPRALVACALRADFYGEGCRYPEIRKALQDNQVVVGSMSPDELRQAICCPAEAAGLDIEPGLVEVLLRDLRYGPVIPVGGSGDLAADYDAGRLPLLAHALQATWQQRHGSTLTVDGYLATGGIDHAIADSAEQIFGRLNGVGQDQARSLFLRLVKIGENSSGDVRRTASLPVVPGDQDVAAAVADAYTRSRLLTRSRDAVQITHESLLRAWPRLRAWLDEDRASHLIRQEIEDAAADWDRSRREPSRLYRGPRLEAAASWASRHAGELTPAARQFLAAAQQLSQRTSVLRRTAVTAVTVLALVASVTSVVALQQRSTAIRQRNTAIYNQIIATANQINEATNPADASNPSLAAQLLLVAYRIRPSRALATQLIDSQNEPFVHAIITNGTGDYDYNSVAFSRYRHILAGAGSDGTVRLWDTTHPARPRQIGRIAVTDAPNFAGSLAFSPNGKILAIGEDFGKYGASGALTLWDVADPAHPRQLSKYELPDDPVDSVAFSPDGRTLATGDADEGALWDTTHPAHPRLLRRLGSSLFGELNSVAFSLNGRMLATGDENDEVTLWNVANRARPRQLGQHSTNANTVNSVVFSPDEHILASGDENGTVTLWDIANPSRLRKLGQSLRALNDDTDYPVSVNSLSFSPDGRTLASGYDNGTVRVWGITSPLHPRELGLPLTAGNGDTVTSVAFSPDGRTLAVAEDEGTIAMWSIPSTVLAADGPVKSIAFSPNDHVLAIVDNDGGRLWDVADLARTRQVGGRLTTAGFDSSAAFSRDNRALAIGDGRYDKLWDVTKPAQPRKIDQRLAEDGGAVGFSPVSPILAASDDSGTVKLWSIADLDHPRQIGEFTAYHVQYNYPTISVTFSPDGHTLATNSVGFGPVQLWNITDPRDPRQIGKSLSSSTAVWSVAFSPGDRTLATGYAGGTIRLWNISDLSRPRQIGQPLTAQGGGIVNSVAFSPDGQTLAAGYNDGAIRLWNVANTASPDQTGDLLPALNSGPVNSVIFSPDGHGLASGDSGGTALLWNLNVSSAINRICRTTGLSRRQWRQYIRQIPYKPPCSPQR